MVIGFDGRHPRAEGWVRERAGDLISAIIADQRQAVRDTVLAGLEAGTGPRTVALGIVGEINQTTQRREGGIVGLTSQQAAYVTRARAELADPARMANYLTRARRDRRFDGLVEAALDAGKPVSATDIARITGRYSDRLLKLRGDTIARTEGITALRAGQYEGYRQLVDSGKVQADRISIEWRSAMDSRTRHDHLALNRTRAKFGQPFVDQHGNVMDFPGDVSHGASGATTINCRCTAVYAIDRRRF